ncbi:MAG TPA: outer membrane beta-barrel protein [Vicinamibacterales bacterium]|nr:outer membrane beta-barrel protein [Vicinamibacterales bacterium]
MNPHIRTLIVSAVAFCATVTPVLAQSTGADAEKRTSIHGFASFAYTYRFDRPVDGPNELRVFDGVARRFRLDVAELVVERSASEPGRFGYRADVVTGFSIPRISAASGLFRNPSTGVVSPEDLDIQQAFLSYVAEVGHGIRVDAGKFTTHVGAEVIEGFDGFGDTYSRGLLFGFAEPFTHTGVRFGYTFTPAVSATVMVVNGWDNVRDNNRAKSVGVQFALKPSKTATMFLNYIGGPERADSADRRHLIDIVSVVTPRPGTTLTVSADLGRESGAAGGSTATWYGVSGSVKTEITPVASVAVRAEWFSDPQGTRTGVSQSLVSMTFSPAFKAGDHLVLRGEARLDRSSHVVFTGVNEPRRFQATTAFNALVIF